MGTWAEADLLSFVTDSDQYLYENMDKAPETVAPTNHRILNELVDQLGKTKRTEWIPSGGHIYSRTPSGLERPQDIIVG